MATDYKTRLTADTSQHDNALGKSAQQVYKYRKQVDTTKTKLSDLAKKFGPLAAQIGIAGGALATLNKTFRSTEQGADALDRTLYAAKSSVNKFFQSISSGNFDAFITGLGDIVSTAKEAYNALDDLGTMKMWKGARMEQLKALIAEDRVIVNNSNSSASDRKAAQQRIEINMQKIQALTGDIVDQTIEAATKKLRDIAGTSKVADNQLQKYLTMWEQGTLDAHMRAFAKAHSHTETYQSSGRGGMNGGFVYTSTQTKWDDRKNELLFNAMKAISTTNEENLQQYYDLLKEAAVLQQQTAAQQVKANNLTTKGSTTKEVKRTMIEIEKLGDAIEQMPTLGASIIDGDAIAAELQKVIDSIEETGTTIFDLQKLSDVGESIGYIGDMFSSLSDVVGEESGKVFQAIGSSISAVGQAIAKISSLMMAEGAANVMDLPYPANLAALATVIATVTSVIGSIASVASQQFAEGGIVKGSTTIGDFVPVRANAGEMILNGTQQSRLFKMLNNPTISTTLSGGENVTFTIHGSDLQGTLNNYNRKRGRVI